MRNKVLENITKGIKSFRPDVVDLELKTYFEELLKEYDFKFIHNKIYSRETDKAYNEDCKTIHILTIGFNYYLKKSLPKSSKVLPGHLNDASNSVLLKFVSKPSLVDDILKYLHCYIFGLSSPATDRCVTASEFLKFEHMLKKYQKFVESNSVQIE